jgi:hypothetical protein
MVGEAEPGRREPPEEAGKGMRHERQMGKAGDGKADGS